MNMKEVMQGYDYDLPLLDTLNAVDDPDITVHRRLLAGAAIGEGLDTAYFATCEMAEAFVALECDARRNIAHGEGFLLLEDILQAKNPFQMRLWYLLNERPIGAAMIDLAWLKSLTYRRGRMARVLRDEKLPVEYVPARDLVAGTTAADMMAGVAEKN
ncbi:hypothetical protein [Sphingomonas lacusdianchii]|uniref:hypothetical protein n=1 Tax=Sphingomonas lacusdianchii TaxID=2917992 RepID=UPI001F5A21D7|nr:hypothetical protein [Sphingomonas sp. JXJ CY 53]